VVGRDFVDDAAERLLNAMRARGVTIHLHDTPINRALAEDVVEPKLILVAGDKLGAPTLIVCALCDDEHPLMFLDNQVADCVSCGRRVQFRPDCPPGPRHCIPCALALVEAP
jgi:hypothetical protein